jgi:cleavage and polyadenylation specificity factor subunit 4
MSESAVVTSTSADSAPKSAAERLLSQRQRKHHFKFDDFLRTEYRYGLDQERPICRLYVQGFCPMGNNCLDRHSVSSTARIVCKHWLRGLCKKGDGCEFLHEYNLRKMPDCYFFAKHGWCSNGEECLYLHNDPNSNQIPCEWYTRGFCPLGRECSKKHVQKVVCPRYLSGFCMKGPECTEGSHPKFDLPQTAPRPKTLSTVEDSDRRHGGV